MRKVYLVALIVSLIGFACESPDMAQENPELDQHVQLDAEGDTDTDDRPVNIRGNILTQTVEADFTSTNRYYQVHDQVEHLEFYGPVETEQFMIRFSFRDGTLLEDMPVGNHTFVGRPAPVTAIVCKGQTVGDWQFDTPVEYLELNIVELISHGRMIYYTFLFDGGRLSGRFRIDL